MKNLLPLLIFILLIFAGCKKDDPAVQRTATPNCSIDFNLVKDIEWHHVNGVFADLKFESGGIYYENAGNDGTWTLSNNCDVIHITRPSNNFDYTVNFVSADTLKISNLTFGEVVYYN